MSLKLPRNWDFSTFKAETARIARSRSVIPGVGASRPGSPLSPRSMERPLKAGWLKKQQRSLVKNWQQRYFVLRGSSLTYHKDDKETTVQGVIQLRFSKVNELSPNSDDPGKYLFEIIPRTTKDREPCPYVLMANSQNDMDEWVRTLRRVIGVPTSGVFGRSLMDTVTYEQRFGPHMVPILVQKCVEFIKEHGLEEEGIFRLPGQDNAVKQFRDAFDAGERPSFPSDTDVHTVASLLKLYLRELPEPVVPWTQYQAFLDCTEHPDSSSTEGWGNLEKQIALLPRNNYNLLSYVCRFLFEVQLHCQVNKMNVENLATVMGINLLKPQIEDPISVMKATPQIQKLMTVLIRQHEALLPDLRPSPPLNRAESQKSTPRSFVGWESAEMCDASAFESPEEEEDTDSPGPGPSPGPSPGRGNCSPQHERQEPCSPSTDDWTGSPRKRTQTLPTFNCPLTGMAAKTDALNRWSHIQESVEEKSGTLSEDIFKILDLRSSGSLFRKAHTGGVSERTFIATAGSGNTCSPSADSQKPASNSPLSRVLTVQKSLGTVAGMASVEQVNNGRSVQKKESQQPIGSLQQNRDLKINSGELHDIAELMSCLKEAERSRDEAQRRNLELQSTLAAESRQVADLKICLRNAEHHRDEAQRRNEELTKEIQRFLDKEP